MDGTKGQVLTKQSETNGDANWEDIEANEVYIGNEEEAPSSAKIIVEEDDFVESAGLSKAEIFVGAEEPTTGEKVWFRKGKNLFNKNVSIITGYYLDNEGSLVSNEGSWYQNVFIEVNSKTQYTISSTVAVLRICFYDKDRKFISRVATENTSVTFSTPENCKYVRLSGDNVDTQVQSLQLEQGSKATSYEAYIEPQIFVRNSNGVYEEYSKQIKKELLWENSTNSTLSATDITLSNDDYDELEVQYCASSLYAVGDKSEIVTKNRSIQLSASLYDSDHKCMITVSRLIKRNSDTSFSAETAYYTNLTTPNSGTDPRFCIPLKIYGIKRR